MLSRSKYLFINIVVCLIIVNFLLSLSCTNQFTSINPDSDEPGVIPWNDVVVVAVGDVMLSRLVGEKIIAEGDPKVPFSRTEEILEQADITFCNLESPFYDEESLSEDWMVFRADPANVEGLKYAGFDIVSLANNHFGDQGTAGMYFTFSHLKKNEIEYIGAGESESQAREPKIIDRNGVKFAFLGYNDVRSAIRKGYAATPQKPGIAVLTRENLVQDIEIAKKKAHVVIVSIHWGIEYEQTPTERQRMFAHLAVDSGASLVLGHHPHVIQDVEEYKDGYIFYSLGNFVFDQMWSEETRRGLIARISFQGKLIQEVETIKVIICDYYQPCPVIPITSKN